MMCIVRQRGERPTDPGLTTGVRIVLARQTPEIVAEHADEIDVFCVGDDATPERLRAEGHTVIMLRDGWYRADGAGGIAIWGQGAYWEVRDTPFDVREAAGPAAAVADSTSASGEVNVRRAIFGV